MTSLETAKLAAKALDSKKVWISRLSGSKIFPASQIILLLRQVHPIPM